ncbi:MAG TPA: ATPase, partial [Chloroflexaceae bacterium]|nr:ATPase [Chloroflexaceae bacterium]
ALYDDGEVLDPAAPARPAANEREVRLAIPFLDAKLLDIALASEEVVVRHGQLRRHVLLPGLVSGGRLRAKVDPDEVLRLWVE